MTPSGHRRSLPTTNSSDDGSADPRLRAALDAGDAGRISAALVDARLIVGVVALPGTEHASEGEMALALLESSSGARALPAFTDLDALARWRTDARPVPRPATELAAAVQAEGMSALVVDVAGPVPWTVRADEVAALAAGYVPAGEALAARRTAPTLRPPSWTPSPELAAACADVEAYALDLEQPGRRDVTPALGVVLPPGVAPAPLAERLLAAADGALDLLVLDDTRLREARQSGIRVGELPH